ncbi:Protein CBG27267 [Caenorhabditis briggsae]|uniref:Protein CBG27267 n=1 Tax=Caenorhabditis briggsae TaxID=6238 RepID=B6IFT6_CAEBR|nr:Protein CBG27267 [Caenorhabditis briggsae]CAR98804.1 Protein CBG27267 [Caenorhabditis briggsae]
MSVQKEQPKMQVKENEYEEENTNSPSSILESPIPDSLLSLKEKIIGPPKTRKVQKRAIGSDLDELYPPTCKFVVSCCKSCHGFRAGLGVLRTDEYKCPNCKHASEGLMAFATLEEGIWFKNYLILMDLYQKLQSRLQMAILDEGSFKLRSVDMVPVPEICGFTNHLLITQDWNFQPNMKEWVMCEPSTEMPKL